MKMMTRNRMIVLALVLGLIVYLHREKQMRP